jgi:hypothetical protein
MISEIYYPKNGIDKIAACVELSKNLRISNRK